MNGHSEAIKGSPLVSVLVPVFNVEQYIEESIRSILKQSHENLEIIIIDDCSHDSTYDIALKLSKKDSRIKLFRNKKNIKIVHTLNRALTLATGEFIARCDGDDVMAHDRIEKQLGFLSSYPQIALVGCSFSAIDMNGNYLRDTIYPSGPELLRQLLPYCSPVSHIWLARKDLYESLGGYRLTGVEDYDFLLRAHLKGFKFDNIPGYIGMKIRIRDGNTVSSFGLAQRRLFNYARHLYKMSLAGKDLFNPAEESRLIAASISGVIPTLHRTSDRISQLGARSRSTQMRYFFYLISAFISPYKLQSLYFATSKIILIKVHGKKSNTQNHSN